MSRILITGAAGMIGRALLEELVDHEVIATDVHRPEHLPDDVTVQRLDVTGDHPADDPDRIIAATKPDVIVHLASIVTPPKGSTRDFEFRVDVTGTQNVLDAARKHGVRRLVVTSSGAAYGYHADNPVPLREGDAIRGNRAFAYAWHKRHVEEILVKARREAPELEQVVLRVGTVLDQSTDNQITALFQKSRLLAVRGSDSPFVFIWTRDLARILARAATDGPAGIYNVAGDGALGVRDLARIMGKPVVTLPAWALKMALRLAKPLGLSRYGPEQVRFLQFRPVLANDALKSTFGYIPEMTSEQVFCHWLAGQGA